MSTPFLCRADFEGKRRHPRAQTKTGIDNALGKMNSIITDEPGIDAGSSAVLTKRLYETLKIHASAVYWMKIWLIQEQHPALFNFRRGGQAMPRSVLQGNSAM